MKVQNIKDVNKFFEVVDSCKGKVELVTGDKEVINMCSGRRLGCIVDAEINICTGEVEAVIIPGPGKICGFLGTDCEYVIPFACIRKIGPDIIIVEIQEEKFLQKF